MLEVINIFIIAIFLMRHGPLVVQFRLHAASSSRS